MILEIKDDGTYAISDISRDELETILMGTSSLLTRAQRYTDELHARQQGDFSVTRQKAISSWQTAGRRAEKAQQDLFWPMHKDDLDNKPYPETILSPDRERWGNDK